MSKQRQNKQMGSSSDSGSQLGDTTYTKIFIGGLAWATQRDSISRYFERFGEISEAVVIFDKRTGRSKGYGFVTFKDPDSAMKACHNPYPIIDGRRTNCNLAAFGAQKSPTTPQNGFGSLRATSQTIMPPASNSLGVSTYFCQNIPEYYAFPYSTYGFPCYSQSQDIFVLNYYNGYSGSPNNEVYLGYYPSFTLQGESNKVTENPSNVHVSQPYDYDVTRANKGTRMVANMDPETATRQTTA